MQIPKPQQYKTKVSEKYYLTENNKYLLIKLELIEPKQIEYLAGQYVSIKINKEGERRSYSIASTPDNQHGVMIVAELLPEGKGSKYLIGLEVGAEVEILGPMGQLVVRGGEKKLFVATGSGIVPLKAMIEDLLINKSEMRPMRLHWGMRREEDLFWFDNLERLSEEHPNFVFDQVLSKPSAEWSLCTGHVQDCLSRDFGSTSSPQVGLSEWEAYVCGSQEAVREIQAELIRLGMKQGVIYEEKFS